MAERSMSPPTSSDVYVPSEHETHRSCWMAWPYLAHEWSELKAAQREHLALIAAIAETEPVDLLVHPSTAVPDTPTGVRVHRLAYGDAWTRDTLPVMARVAGREVALVFDFDGWGGKYAMEGDLDLAPRIAEAFGLERRDFGMVLEGGGIEVDGEGTLLTTEPWLRRLAERSGEELESMRSRLGEVFGAEKVLSVEAMLANDHTDGHVDTLVRFVRPGEVVIMGATPGDPNGAMLLALHEQLAQLTDARGRTLRVHQMPSPGAITDDEGELLAASYANYYLANEQVLVPTYGVAADAEALSVLQQLFPARRVRGLDARAIVSGGGAFHCITQQRPA